MVAALHILSIKVSGWKAIPHDNPVIIDFCDGSLRIFSFPTEQCDRSFFGATGREYHKYQAGKPRQHF